MATVVLNKEQTLQKIKRIAYQIYENNFQEKEIVLVGIEKMGYYMASFLENELKKITPSIHFELVYLRIGKGAYAQPIELGCDIQNLADKVVILVDDVINTGKTAMYSLQPFFAVPLKKLQTVFLINRNYKLFPVAADYVGYALATTFQEHIQVILDDQENMGVYLS